MLLNFPQTVQLNLLLLFKLHSTQCITIKTEQAPAILAVNIVNKTLFVRTKNVLFVLSYHFILMLLRVSLEVNPFTC